MEKFQQLGLPQEVTRAIQSMGFTEPTSIQERAIPILMENESDVIALAQTGTGKTAAFGLPLISHIDPSSKNVAGLILCPTRELCLQITKDLQNFAANSPNIKITAIYGGANIVQQMRDLKRGTHIIVATPGRMVDMLNRGAVSVENLEVVVLDEADEMLNMGFKDELDTILKTTPREKKTWLFSATMPKEVARIAKTYMNNPIQIEGDRANQSNINITHTYSVVRNTEKYTLLRRIIDANPDLFAIVFCRTRRDTKEIAEKLIQDGYQADALHGDLSQAQREMVMGRYRNRSLKLLIATDVAARGLDVDDVSHVIHYQLPDEAENYTHRSGRTARAGKSGESIALLTTKDKGKLRIFEKAAGIQWKEYQIPEPKDIVQSKIIDKLEVLKNTPTHPEIELILNSMSGDFAQWDVRSLLSKVMTVEFNRLFEYYKNEKGIQAGGDNFGSGNKNVTKLFVNLGKFDRISEVQLVEFLASMAGVPQGDFVFTSMRNSYSFVEVKNPSVNKLVKACVGVFHGDRPVVVEVREESQSFDKGRKRKPMKERASGGGGFKRSRNKFSDSTKRRVHRKG